jgi:hypothetical protein
MHEEMMVGFRRRRAHSRSGWGHHGRLHDAHDTETRGAQTDPRGGLRRRDIRSRGISSVSNFTANASPNANNPECAQVGHFGLRLRDNRRRSVHGTS